MTRRWSEREREQHIEDLKEVRRRFRQEVVEAKQSGNTYAYVQARKKLFEVQQEIEKQMDLGSHWRLTMQRKRERKRERWRRTGMKAGQPYVEEDEDA